MQVISEVTLGNKGMAVGKGRKKLIKGALSIKMLYRYGQLKFSPSGGSETM